MAKYIGKEMSRVDGFAKVTGQAKYAAEFAVKNVAYGFIATRRRLRRARSNLLTRARRKNRRA